MDLWNTLQVSPNCTWVQYLIRCIWLLSITGWATLLEIWWKQERKVYRAIQSPCCQRFRLAVTLLREKQMKIGVGDFIWIISCFDWQSSVLVVPRLLTSEEDRLGEIKTQVQFNVWIQLSALWGKNNNIKWKLNLISTEEIPLTWAYFFFE